MQRQDKFRWEPSFVVVRSFIDQLERSGDLSGRLLRKVNDAVDRAEGFSDRGKKKAAKATLRALAKQLRGREFRELREAIEDLAGSHRRHWD